MAITDVILSKLEKTNPLVVGISGPSASGKSHLAHELKSNIEAASNVHVTIVSQDDFSIGKNFKDKDTSRYRWDDPEYYRLMECRKAIEALKANRAFSFLAYNLHDHDALPTKTLGPLPNNMKTIIMLEGIFAWHPPLIDIVDLKIFTSANFFIRFILRANRNVNQIKNTNFNTVVKQYFSHVMYAEQEILSPLATYADLTVPLEVDIAQIVSQAPTHPKPKFSRRNTQTLYKTQGVELLALYNSQRHRLLVLVDNNVLFDELLTAENVELLQQGKFIR